MKSEPYRITSGRYDNEPPGMRWEATVSKKAGENDV